MTSFSRLFRILALGAGVLACPTTMAFSPAFHEAQTQMAISRVPRRLQQVLRANLGELLWSLRGAPRGRIPSPEEVEEQFRKVLRLCAEDRATANIVRELGVLAHQVQLLGDPSCIQGITPLRDHFQTFADQMMPHLVLTDAPYWSLAGPPEPGSQLQAIARRKSERFALLDAHFDERTGKRLVVWDRLSVPFALLQLSYSQGVHDTANLWILVYRHAGTAWLDR